MTRDEALMLYRPIRAAIRRVLSAAVPVCNQADLTRAAKQLGLWAEGKIFLPEGGKAAEMLSDIALFEANQRGRRVRSFSLRQGAAIRRHRLRTGPADGQGLLLIVSLYCTARDGRNLD